MRTNSKETNKLSKEKIKEKEEIKIKESRKRELKELERRANIVSNLEDYNDPIHLYKPPFVGSIIKFVNSSSNINSEQEYYVVHHTLPNSYSSMTPSWSILVYNEKGQSVGRFIVDEFGFCWCNKERNRMYIVGKNEKYPFELSRTKYSEEIRSFNK